MLQLINVNKTFNPGTVNENHAIVDFSVTINDSDYISVIGGNGAGKSTILNLISGGLIPDSGKILFDGSDVTHMPEHTRAKYIGRVFQDPMMGTASDMIIEENLALAFRRGKRRGLKWYRTEKERQTYRDMLAELDL